MALLYETSDHIATITINRPDALNSIDLETWGELSEACARLEGDDDVWVGIITGAGNRSFSAGADLKETIPTLINDPRGNRYDEPDTIMRGQTVTKPLIAAVNGLALGGGLEIVLACDLRIAAEGARFGAPEITLGFIPGWGATQRLARELPWAIASKLVLGGDQIGAETALQYGLVNEVVPADRPAGRRPPAGGDALLTRTARPARGQARHARGARPVARRRPAARARPLRQPRLHRGREGGRGRLPGASGRHLQGSLGGRQATKRFPISPRACGSALKRARRCSRIAWLRGRSRLLHTASASGPRRRGDRGYRT